MSVAGAGEAYDALRALLEGGAPAAVTAFRWQNEDEDSEGELTLPDEPAPFVYAEFSGIRSGGWIENGHGRGGNRHRHPAILDLYVFTPRGEGLRQADGSGCLDIADDLAALLRPYNQGGVTVERVTVGPGGAGAELAPPGLRSEVGRYFWAFVSVDLYFDLIG